MVNVVSIGSLSFPKLVTDMNIVRMVIILAVGLHTHGHMHTHAHTCTHMGTAEASSGGEGWQQLMEDGGGHRWREGSGQRRCRRRHRGSGMAEKAVLEVATAGAGGRRAWVWSAEAREAVAGLRLGD